MTEDMTEIARRAVAATHWRWLPGMLRTSPGAHHGIRVLDVNAVGIDRTHPLPDLTDPATLGCLLHLVRTAWHAPRALVRLSSDGRSFHVFDVDRVRPTGGNWAAWLSDDRCPSEAHALVDALTRAAP